MKKNANETKKSVIACFKEKVNMTKEKAVEYAKKHGKDVVKALLGINDGTCISVPENSMDFNKVYEFSDITKEDIELIKQYSLDDALLKKMSEAQFEFIIKNEELTVEQKNDALKELKTELINEKEHAEDRASAEAHKKRYDNRNTAIVVASCMSGLMLLKLCAHCLMKKVL